MAAATYHELLRCNLRSESDFLTALRELAREPDDASDDLLADTGIPSSSPLVAFVPNGDYFGRCGGILSTIFRRPFGKKSRARITQYARMLAEAFDAFIESHSDIHILLLCPGQARETDVRVASLVQQNMKHARQTRLISGNGITTARIRKLFKRCEIGIGMQAASLLLLASVAVPSVGLAFSDAERAAAAATDQTKTFTGAASSAQQVKSTMEICWLERRSRRERLRNLLDDLTDERSQSMQRLQRTLDIQRAQKIKPQEPAPEVQPIPVKKRSQFKNISKVTEEGLCLSCGTCYAVCPRNNIRVEREWDDQPQFVAINDTVCADCGLCLKVCPGYAFDFAAGRQFTFGHQPQNSVIGCYRKLNVTRSNRAEYFRTSFTGATVDEIIRYLLEQRKVDGVAVTSIDCSGTRPRPRTWIARHPSDVLLLQGSIFMSAPTNMVLRDLLQSGGPGRIALIGLSCHIQGLRAAQQHVPELRDRVPLAIGLFCCQEMRPAGTWHLMQRLGVSPGEVSSLEYRTRLASGGLFTRTHDGRTRELKSPNCSYAYTCYANNRCAMCVDPLAELADISIGDTCTPQLQGAGAWNITVARTEWGEAIIEDLVENGRLQAFATSEEQVIQLQRPQLYHRQRRAWARMNWRQRSGQGVPSYEGIEPGSVQSGDMRRELEIMMAQRFAQTRWVQPLMRPAAWITDRLSGFFSSR